jgi:hypothetical protein
LTDTKRQEYFTDMSQDIETYDFLPNISTTEAQTTQAQTNPDTIQTSTQKLHNGNPRKIDLKKAIDMRLKGITLDDIAKYFGCTKQSVHERLKPYVDSEDIDLELWKEKRADILAGKQATALSLLTPDDIKKASAKDKSLIFAILYDKERLERGQSTSNVSVLFRVAEEAEKIQQEGYAQGLIVDAEVDES